MTASEYKEITLDGDVIRRLILEETAKLLPSDSNLRASLSRILSQQAIKKPQLHQGGEDSDYFRVDLGESDVNEIIDVMLAAEADAVDTNGETTGRASLLSGAVDEWATYLEFKNQTSQPTACCCYDCQEKTVARFRR